MLPLYIALTGLVLMFIGLICSIFLGVMMSKTMNIVGPILKSYIRLSSDPFTDETESLMKQTEYFLDRSVEKLPMLAALMVASIVTTVLGLTIFGTGVITQLWLLST